MIADLRERINAVTPRLRKILSLYELGESFDTNFEELAPELIDLTAELIREISINGIELNKRDDIECYIDAVDRFNQNFLLNPTLKNLIDVYYAIIRLMEAQYHMCKNSIQVLFNTHELIDREAPILLSKYIRYWEEKILEECEDEDVNVNRKENRCETKN